MIRWLSLLAALFVGLPVAWQVTQTVSAQPAPVVVSVVNPARKVLPRVVEQPGTIQADEETHLHARIAGVVDPVHADIGLRVKKGDPLAELDVPDLVAESKARDAQVKRAEAEVEQARKGLSAGKANVRAVKAQGDESQAAILRTLANQNRWALEAQRVEGLVQRGILEVQLRDETVNQYAAARAAHAEAQARLVSAQELVRKADADSASRAADVEAALARAEVARAEAARVQALLGFAKITAPYDGVVTRRRVNTGDFVQPAAAKGDALFTVARLDPVRLVIAVPEADAGLVDVGTPVKFTLTALKEKGEGKVARSSWSLEPGARTLRVEVDLPNPGQRLRPGMYATTQLTGQLPQQWTLPATAVVKQGNGLFCFAIEGGKAMRLPVQVGASDGKSIEVLRLSQTEPTGKERIAASATGLTDGAAVREE